MSVTMFFNSCLGGIGEPTIFSDDSTKAKARMEQIIEAVKNRDKDTLRAMFSERALKEAENLDGQTDKLFDFVDGGIVSWEQDIGSVRASNNHGIKTKESSYWFLVNTDTEEYTFRLVEYTEDTEHPENVGLYMLQAYKTEDREKEAIGKDEWRAGVYLPKEQDESPPAGGDAD
jgi:hypothetical protein